MWTQLCPYSLHAELFCIVLWGNDGFRSHLKKLKCAWSQWGWTQTGLGPEEESVWSGFCPLFEEPKGKTLHQLIYIVKHPKTVDLCTHSLYSLHSRSISLSLALKKTRMFLSLQLLLGIYCTYLIMRCSFFSSLNIVAVLCHPGCIFESQSTPPLLSVTCKYLCQYGWLITPLVTATPGFYVLSTSWKRSGLHQVLILSSSNIKFTHNCFPIIIN